MTTVAIASDPWLDARGLTPAAQIILCNLADAETDGLDPEHYRLSTLRGLVRGLTRGAEGAVAFNALLTDAYLSYGTDLVQGRTEPASVLTKWDGPDASTDPESTLVEALDCDQERIVAALAACRPAHRDYQTLRTELLRLRDIAAAGGWWYLTAGPVLRAGDTDPRVSRLRHRLAISGDYVWTAVGSADSYDRDLVTSVRRFQRRCGLTDDGVVGPRTLAALNVGAGARARQVVANLERLRWLPDERGSRHIWVNVPDQQLEVVVDGQTRMRMRAIVGRRTCPTPVVSSNLSWLVLNPYWNVPQKLARRDILPRAIADPNYLVERGFRVFETWDAGAPQLDPLTIDWAEVVPGDMAYKFQQDPGPDNPLGRVKFLFPNRYNAFIHDTNHRGTFARRDRARSSGCVRVEDSEALLVEVLQGREPATASASIESPAAAKQREAIGLMDPVPLHLVYFTAWVDCDGVLQYRDDIYGYDDAVWAALNEVDHPVLARNDVSDRVVAQSSPTPVDGHQERTGPVSMWMKPGPE